MKSGSEKRRKKMWFIITAVVCVLVVVWNILVPPSRGKAAPIVDEDGNPVPGSIAEKSTVELNGTKFGMILKGKNQKKPVLLFLGGGPGIPEYLLEKEYPTGLEEEFVVCYFDYRGTGLSYYHSRVTKKTMTTKQYIEDAVAVTNYLRKRFNQDKIYLIAHSFGSYIGLNTVSLHPELYHAYIAMSQMTDQRESEYLAYEYMLEQYRIKGNSKKVRQFEETPIRESDQDYLKYFSSMLRDSSMHELGIGTTRKMDSIITGIILPGMRCKDYTPLERILIFRSRLFAVNTEVAHDFQRFNAFEKIQEIAVPIYFLAGRYDYTCCYSLQKKYYEQIKAPLKEFYTFEESAHSPIFEEPEKGVQILTEIAAWE